MSAMFTNRRSQNQNPPPRNDDPNVASETPKRLPPNVRDEYPYWTYGKFLLLLLAILLLSLGFFFRFHAKGPRPAPMAIVDFIGKNPRLAPQIITVIGSACTVCVKWGFAGAFTTYARKHLQRSHPVRHIELLSALKNGGLVWSWDTTRLPYKAGTLAATVLCGLLTSGFVALITPFPVATESPIDAGTMSEFNLASPDASCFQWSKDTYTNYPGDCTNLIRYSDTNLVYYNCSYRDVFGDDITSVESAMVYRYASNLYSQQLSTLVKSFPLLSNTRLIGGTAGALPLGPRGIDAFPNSALPYHPTATSSFNYTLKLQGIWAESSCSYTNNPLLSIPQPVPGQSRLATLNCPSGDTAIVWDRSVFPESKTGMILAGVCYNDQRDTATFHLRSLWNSSDSGLPPATGSRLYAGIGAVECSFAPRTGIVDATYQTDLAAFNMTRPAEYTSFSSMGPLAKAIVADAMRAALGTLAAVRSEWNGNRFGGSIYYVARLYGNVTAQQQDPLVLELVADGLKGLFEFHITKRKFRLAAFEGPPPNQTCFRPVTGRYIERHIGWNFSGWTAGGLVPLTIICLSSISLILWTMLQRGNLTRFDPTEPVSLVAAAGDGKLRFIPEAIQRPPMAERTSSTMKQMSPMLESGSFNAEQTSPIGDPDDQFVKNTNVVYGEEYGTWGLRAKTE